jgi:hypothetical protein
MPLEIANAQEMVAANDELAACDTKQQLIAERTRLHREWCAASTNECWPFQRASLATIEEIHRAHALRLQLRERYKGQTMTSNAPWCVGVD